MGTKTLFYKEHIICDNNVDIIFHQDYSYIFNETAPFPVVKFSLINCRNLSQVTFQDLDYYNDGVNVDIGMENERTFFQTTDIGDVEIKIFCDKVIRQDIEYRQHDLIGIIKSIKKESDDSNERMTMFSNRIEYLKKFLNHDFDVIKRKLEQANWLAVDKKQFFEGQKSIIDKVLYLIGKKEKEDFQKRQAEKKL